MKVRFYMNAAGEVLSNVDYPVTRPGLMVPTLPRLTMLTEPGMEPRWKNMYYRAITIEVPDD